MSARATRSAIACAALLAGCGGGSRPVQPGRYALQARLGVYQDGSGRAGLAVLATLRDDTGAGPSVPWSAAVSDATGTIAVAEYAGAGAGSYAAWWWPEVAVRDGVRYTLTLSDGETSVATIVRGSSATGLPLAAPVLSADSSRIEWNAVAGAAGYACRVYQSGAIQLDGASAGPGCDLSTLPPGGYSASILATGANLAQISASTAQTPALPSVFDVSESRIAFVLPEAGGTAFEMLAAGGAYDFGTSERGLAFWVAIREPGGTATTRPWTVSVTGPGISPSAAPTFEYQANLPRMMKWSYGIPATPGSYSLTATSGTTGLTAGFQIGYPQALPFVVDASATAGASGSAQVTWSPVEGARAYLVDVWDRAYGTQAASMWVAAPPAQFQPYTFTTGRAYDVYVAATDVDMSGGTVPTQVSVSEYPFIHASFTE